jgi:hypothetical protein
MAVINSWEEFFNTVDQMMAAQQRYFSCKTQANLRESKAIEKVVRDFIKDRKDRMARKSQPTMFEEEK